MGSCISTAYVGELKKEWLDVFYAMKLKRSEVVKLFEVFNQIDCDRRGTILVKELLNRCSIERTDFTGRIFSAFDKDHTGNIDFYEFVVSLWKFCTLGSGAIAVFTFDVYDSNADGILTYEEALRMHGDLETNKSSDDVTKSGIMTLTNKCENGSLLVDDFLPYCRTHQAFLLPIFTVQNKLKVACLGASFWDSLSQRRIQLRPGFTVPLAELMVLHSDRKLFRQLLEDQTVMSLTSMMKTVLENTDNTTHYADTRSLSVKIKSQIVGMVSSTARSSQSKNNHKYYMRKKSISNNADHNVDHHQDHHHDQSHDQSHSPHNHDQSQSQSHSRSRNHSAHNNHRKVVPVDGNTFSINTSYPDIQTTNSSEAVNISSHPSHSRPNSRSNTRSNSHSNNTHANNSHVNNSHSNNTPTNDSPSPHSPSQLQHTHSQHSTQSTHSRQSSHAKSVHFAHLSSDLLHPH